MPWDISVTDGKFNVVNKDTGEAENNKPFNSKSRAMAYMRALYAHSGDKSIDFDDYPELNLSYAKSILAIKDDKEDEGGSGFASDEQRRAFFGHLAAGDIEGGGKPKETTEEKNNRIDREIVEKIKADNPQEKTSSALSETYEEGKMVERSHGKTFESAISTYTPEQQERLKETRNKLIEEVHKTQDIVQTWPKDAEGKTTYDKGTIDNPLSKEDVSYLADKYFTRRLSGVSHNVAASQTIGMAFRHGDTFNPHGRIAEMRQEDTKREQQKQEKIQQAQKEKEERTKKEETIRTRGKLMTSKFPGRDVITGEKFQIGEKIYYHSQGAVIAERKQKSLSLFYAKSLLTLPDADLISRLAVKSIGKDEIQAYTFLWGSPAQKDIERDYFTPETNFWDDILGKSARPLTWDHAQDADMKASPVIGMINDFGDDDVGRWYTAHLDRAHKYRKAIDALIERGLLGSSSDSASQYVRKVKKGMSNQIVEWPWFASALTDAPCEPRMLDEGKAAQYFKSLGVSLPVEPETSQDAKWLNAERLKLLKFYTEEA